MLPTLEIGPWHLHTYIFTYVLAALAVYTCSVLRLRRLDVPLLTLLRGALVVTVAGFACAYLVRLVPTVQDYLATGVWRWVSGNSYVGGLLGGVAVFCLIFHRCGVSLGRALDQVLPVLALGQAIGRLGCLAAGCCYGRPTVLWPGMYLPDNRGNWAVRYPTQLLSAAADLLILAALLAIERRGDRREQRGQPWPPGLLALLYVGLYCLERFAVEFLRADDLPALGPISGPAGGTAVTWVQLYTVPGMILVVILVLRQLAARRREKGVAP